NHDEARDVIIRHLGLSVEEMWQWKKDADWAASAADRYPFPKASQLYVDWSRGGEHAFHHPLCGSRLVPERIPRQGSHVGEKWLEDSLHGLPFDEADDRARLFRLWRFWAEHSARNKSEMLAYLPADSRIPDHSIWQHNSVCSAIDGAGEKPAFLMMQIGPVQEFIAQSRKMQDLWSGSYLLSYLISKALAAIALELGPESIIFPSLRGVPLLDWAWSQAPGLFPEGTLKLGEGRLYSDELLIPSLPNRFLALVPGGAEGRSIAALAQKAIREEWRQITKSVHGDIDTKMKVDFPGWDNVWSAQVDRFPVIDWTLHEWKKDAAELAAQGTPPLTGGWKNHPLSHADLWRDMLGESKHSWINLGSHWALHYATTDWKFAAAKNARAFNVWKTTLPSAKDHLNGRDEVIGGANNDAFWEALRAAYKGEERGDFKGQQRYGAMTVIKRLWARTYLKEKLGWQQARPRFESVPEIAKIEKGIAEDGDESETYYAVLCMDGDDMGQWVSGQKAPLLTGQLAEKAADFFRSTWKETNGSPDASVIQRPLSPSYHSALSEALNHFSLYAAGQVVEAFKGQLFYAGGDDVLAILPAACAQDCALALKCVFQGVLPADLPKPIADILTSLFSFHGSEGGFLKCLKHTGRSERLRPNWPLIVPGPQATVSIGIAIGHIRQPMQEVIQSAREAETAAKKVPGKSALCLRVLKRSGESAEFAAKFESGVLGVWQELSSEVHDISGRFPYRYMQLLKPLLANSSEDADQGWQPRWTPDLITVCEAELRHVLIQQASKKPEAATQLAERWITHLIGTADTPTLSPKGFLHFWMAWAFVNRISSDT
ncbi:MAG: type III-B CRISPR-associated protein Cas10/Cmr2, partial [Roseimicrobium sp.]